MSQIKIDQSVISRLRSEITTQFAKDMINVQPVDDEPFKALYKLLKDAGPNSAIVIKYSGAKQNANTDDA